MHRNQHRYLLFAAVLLFASAAIAAAEHPNFTGTWKLNLDKSDFAGMPAPASMVGTITHDDPALKLAVKQSSDMGEADYEANYTTDGNKCTNNILGNESTSVVKWDGDALVFETEGNFGGNDIKMNDRLTMSDDGKVLTLTRHISGAFGDADQKYVLEKQ